ncbi:P2X purinoceptor 5 isoform X3 [Sarcophilus harrisii]|uniref:P2X purinoceptor 5 isoform X3 n=1 Tax=Sarcophilus harrisii TaxID=9305 RepID=UPI001301B45A|nr:P2X purinoceptor 5 isoform X3 [Sarcophilus harrisii]
MDEQKWGTKCPRPLRRRSLPRSPAASGPAPSGAEPPEAGSALRPGVMDCRSRCLSIFDYKTEKFVIAKNKKVGLLYRLLQLGVLGYLLGWVFLVKKGYQAVDTTIQSSVITKVKGVAFTNTSELKEHLWDVADYVIPSQGENVFFVVTHMIVTPHQRQTTCAESPHVPGARCSQDSDCSKGEAADTGNGVMTGKCLLGGGNGSGTCEIFAWCPVEKPTKPTKPLLGKAEDFTVYIKNSICFPKFNFSKSPQSPEGCPRGDHRLSGPGAHPEAASCRTNVLHSENPNFLKFCRFSSKTPYCPVFRLGTIVSYTGNDFRKMAMEGGVIGIEIEWNCDLDQAPSACRPHYSFRRLDKFTEPSATAGYNFRFAKYYHDVDGVEFRTLMKVYGIRFDVLVSGKAGKFNIIPLMVNVGTALALMGAGAFFCDFVLLYLIKKSHFYRDKKYEQIRMSSQKFLSRHLAALVSRNS